MTDNAPTLTIAILDRHVAGYPLECMTAVMRSNLENTEILLIAGDDWCADDFAERFSEVHVIRMSSGDRATAKNRAIQEAKGRYVLFLSSDIIVRENAIPRLMAYLNSSKKPAAVSAQLLQENGMLRRTRFEPPSLRAEISPISAIWRFWRVIRKGRPPLQESTLPSNGLHAECLMAARENLLRMGPFSEGHHFGGEDIEWCARARRAGVALYLLREARAFKLCPQLYGSLSDDGSVALEGERWRIYAATHQASLAALFRAAVRVKALLRWAIGLAVNTILCGRSSTARRWRHSGYRIFAMPPQGETRSLAPDIESRVRWELFW